MFHVETKKFGDIFLYKIINKQTKEYFNILPAFGTTINELVLGMDGRNHQILQGYQSYEDLQMNFSQFYRGANLFPFPGRIKNGTYNFQGKTYHLSKNDPSHEHALHGYIYYEKFEIVRVETSEEKGLLETLFKEDGSVLAYPFKFEISVEFQLKETGFSCITRIENTGKDPMPLGQGWHPYFKTMGKTEKMFLQLPSIQYLELDQDLCPTGIIKDMDKFRESDKIGQESLDTVFVLKKVPGISKTYLRDPDYTKKVVLWQETGEMKYNYLTVYTPPERDSIALEPWTCPPDVFNNEIDLITLDPGKKIELAMGISIE
jgi:aldose 1-epimerase